MKNLLKILPLILICVACGSDSEDDMQVNSSHTIGFDAEMATTRAIADADALEDKGFSVWGGFAGQTVFDGRKVTFQNGAWGYENPEVWTFNTYNFHAIYPSYDTGEYTLSATNNFQQIDINNFDANKEIDLLHASATGIDGSTVPVVNLLFKHTLSNISIKLNKHSDNADDNITVKQVYLLGLNTIGSYQWKKDGETITSAWTVDYSQTPVNKGSAFNTELNTTYKDFLTDVLVIPQTVDPDNHPVVLIVVYDFTINSSETIKDNILYANLPASPAWEIGKKITYQATINAKKDIVFKTPTVEDWGTQQVGGTIIIK